ncbi:hypothetical protein PENTCL1PPCAC_20202, partial [Pristionchus entomophagus]
SPSTYTVSSIVNTSNEDIPQCVIAIANAVGTADLKVKEEVNEEEAVMTQAAAAAAAAEVAVGRTEPTAAPAAKSVFTSSLSGVPSYSASGTVEVSTQQSNATVTPSTENTSNEVVPPIAIANATMGTVEVKKEAKIEMEEGVK